MTKFELLKDIGVLVLEPKNALSTSKARFSAPEPARQYP